MASEHDNHDLPLHPAMDVDETHRPSSLSSSDPHSDAITNADTDPSLGNLGGDELSGGDTDIDRDPFEELASEFSERYRNGEMPSVEEYAEQYPDLAAEIRDLFPTIAAMEQLKDRKAPSKSAVGGLELEQLGDFRILGEIGRGGMGVVYEAEQVSLGRHVAVKVLPKQALLDERHLRRFEREAQTAAKLHHTNIVPVFGVGQQDGYHYIVMQFIPGVGLDEILVSLRTMVLDDDAPQYHMDSSSRASHANHNAQALLDGNFSKHVTMNFASSFTKDAKRPMPGTAGGTAATMDIPQHGTGLSGSPRSASKAPTGSVPSALSSGTEPTMLFSGSAVQSSSTNANPAASDIPARIKSLDEDDSKILGSLDREYYRSVAKIGQQVSDALAYAHEQGTLHRDIKPGNLLLDGTGTVWVADFGLAKLQEQDAVSRTGDIVGTLSYMPPESFSGDTDARGDIYALGLTLFEMLAMRPAYYGRDRGKLVKQITDGDLPRLSKLNPAVPRDLETIVLKSIAHRPEDRYATAREMEEDLECFLNDMPIKARRMSLPEQFTRWCRKNKLVASLSAAVLTLLMVSSVTFAFLYQKAQSEYQAAETARQEVVVEKAKVEDKEREAQRQKRIAKNTAREAIDALLVLFDGMFPDRLPPTADQSIAESSSEGDDTNGSDDSSTEEESTATVTAAPVTPEMAARFELLIKSFNKLARRAGSDEFANVFADLSIRVGKLHRQLGNQDEAQENFTDGIDKYRNIVESVKTPSVSSVVGLASSYNEMGDLLKTRRNRAATGWFDKAHSLFSENEELLADSSRARYEEARTYFLQANEYNERRGGPGFGIGRRGGRGGPNRGGGSGRRRGGSGNGRNNRGNRRDESGRARDESERQPRNNDMGPPPAWEDDPNGPPPPRPGEGGPPEPEDGPERPGEFGPRRGGSSNSRIAEFMERRFEEQRRRFEEARRFRIESLEQAVALLKPIVVDKDEANPEFRYLLARCHAGIARISSREDPTKRRESVAAAVRLLSKLVSDHPNVPDYKYEFALLSLEDHGPALPNRLGRTRQAVEFSKEISSKNTAVFDYAKLYFRALEEQAKTLVFLSSDPRDERSTEERIELLVEAKKSLEVAEERRADLKNRFPELSRRLPELGVWKRDADFQHGKLLSELGKTDEAQAILGPLRGQVLNEVKKGIRSPDPRKTFRLAEEARTLCQIEKYLKGNQAAIKLCDQLIKHRQSAMDEFSQSINPNSKNVPGQFDVFRQLGVWALRVSIRTPVLGDIGEKEEQQVELNLLQSEIESFLDSRDARSNSMQDKMAGGLLDEVRRQLDGDRDDDRHRRSYFGRGRFPDR